VSEELANVFTHLVGFVLFLFCTIALVIKAYDHGDAWAVMSAIIFGGSLVNMYLASTLYHAVTRPSLKGILHFGDHVSIFILIAGTYTPFLLVGLRDQIDVSFMIIMWSIACLGILYKVFFFGKYKVVSLILYLAMGWMAILKAKTFYIYLPIEASIWIVIGGLFYSIGTVFYVSKKIPYNHAIWHIFVLCGSVSHFVAVYIYLY